MANRYGKPKVYDVSKPVNVGVLLVPPVQLLDLAPVDLFHMVSKAYLGPIPMLPDFVKDIAMKQVNIYYIAEDATAAGQATSSSPSRPAPLTADLSINLTANFSSPEVAPGKLDVLMIPGPDPTYTPTDAQGAFIRSHFETGTTDILTVCTGIYAAGYSGILDGRSATGPRGLIPELKGKFKNNTHWVAKRWEIEPIPPPSTGKISDKAVGMRQAELWTSAEISNGHDAVAAYIKTYFPRDLADMVCAMADVGQRGQEHANSAAKENAWWGFFMLKNLVKSWFR